MTALPPLAALLLLIPALPIGIWVAWSDMKSMKIPNKAVLALGAGFVAVGLGHLLLGLLPFKAFLWALALGGIVLVLGFVGWQRQALSLLIVVAELENSVLT